MESRARVFWVLLYSSVWPIELLKWWSVSSDSDLNQALCLYTCALKPLSPWRKEQAWAAHWTQKKDERHVSRQRLPNQVQPRCIDGCRHVSLSKSYKPRAVFLHSQIYRCMSLKFMAVHNGQRANLCIVLELRLLVFKSLSMKPINQVNVY